MNTRPKIKWSPRDWPIGTKLSISFVLISLVVVGQAAFSFYNMFLIQQSVEQTLNKGLQIADLGDQIQTNLSDARHQEEAFLLHWQDIGYQEAVSTYIVPHGNDVSAIRRAISELETLAANETTESLSVLNDASQQLSAALAIYRDEFNLTTEFIKERGTIGDGAVGALDRADSELADALDELDNPELIKKLLRLRLNTSKYLLSGQNLQEQYATEVGFVLEELRAALTVVDSTNIKHLQAIDTYEQAFDELTRLDREIAVHTTLYNDTSETIKLLSLGIVSEGNKITNEAITTTTTNIQHARYALIFIVVVAIALSLLLSVILTRQFSIPIQRLTNTAIEIEQGNLDAQASIQSRDEIGTLATIFNSMTSQLRELVGSLEQRVSARTRALVTSSEVSRRLSTILNRRELVIEVVEQVKEAFGYYHAHIYLVEGDELVMAGGTGDVGAAMLAEGHKVPKGRGLVGRAAESSETVLVPDTTQDPDWLPNPLLPDTKSEVAIPISIGDQILGVLDVQHDIKDGLSQEDVDALQSIANQVAVAIQNINQYEKTQKVAADLGVVANVGIATSTITEGERLLQEVVDLSKHSFNLYHAHIYLLNETGDTLELASGAGEVGRKMVAEGRQIPLNSEKSLVARAARMQEGVVVNDVQADPDFLPNPLLPETRAEMAVPMLVSGKVIGVLDVQSEQVNRFTDIDVNIQTTLASQVAVALQNARSFANAQKQAERESRLNIIAQKIQGTATIEEAMQIAARELGHALGQRQTLVALDAAALAGDGKDVVTE